MSTHRQRFINSTNQTMVIWLEPWGGGYELRPGSQLLLVYDAADAGTTESLTVDTAKRDSEIWTSVWVDAAEDYPEVSLDGAPRKSDRS